MITRLGELTLSDVVPLLREIAAALRLAQGIAVAELSAKLAGLANVLLAITVAPPALGATITAALATVASLQAAISGPTVTLQATAIVALIAELNLQLASLIAIQIPDASVSAYAYDGPSAQLGGELQAAIDATLPGVHPGDHANALVLATTSRPAWLIVGQVFKVTL